MQIKKTITILAGSTLILFVLLVSVVVGAMIAEVSISLERLRQPMTDAISEYTGRDVTIDSAPRLTLSLFPALLVKGIHIHNEPGWKSEKIVTLKEARLEVALIPLLEKEYVIQELSAEQAVINLEQDANGNNNWTKTISQSAPASAAPESSDDKKPTGDQASGHQYFTDRFNFDRIRLNNITLNYRDDVARLSVTDQVEKLHVTMHERSHLEADVSGIINDVPYSFTATSDLLRNIPDNRPWKLTLQGNISGNPLNLDANLHIRNGILSGKLDMQASGLDAGRLLEPLGIIKDLDFRANQLHLLADLEGGSLFELVSQSSFDVTLSDGAWKLHSHVDERFQDFTFDKTSITAIPGHDLELEFAGDIGSSPIQMTILTNPLADFFSELERIRLAVAASFSGAKIDLDGHIELPVSSNTLAMNMDVSGSRLDRWNSVMISDLPPYGPYQLSGHLSLTPGGYQVTNFKSAIANSDLNGSVKIDMTKARPVWKMDLISNQLQINDFDKEGYTLIPGKEIIENKSESDNQIIIDTDEKNEKTAKQEERELSKRVDQRLGETREIDHWDIDLTVESRNIYSGNDRIGNGKIVISARVDSFDMATQLNTLGGQIDSDTGLKLDNMGISGHVKLDMDRFNYGIFLRRIDPETQSGGLLSTRVDVRLAGKDFSRRFDRASGQIDFALWPENISAGDIDIWAVNIFQAVSSSVTSADSKLNCMVGILDLDDGQLNEEFLAVDTTKVWLYGNVDINYPSESIELKLLPRTKKPRIAGIETPVYLEGKLTDKFDTSDLSVKKKDMVDTFFSIVFSPLHVPMRRLYGKKVPEDGSEMCGKLLDRSYLKSVKEQIKDQEITWDDVYSGD
jgi:uncharacterized protein involved in outer membrane biogenesis